ncbi:MAG: hypothetical protein WAK60_06505 [Sedimentisphaerales bacterium]
MLLGNWTKSARFSGNAVFIALVLIGIFAIYNWIVVPHENNLMAAQRYRSVTDVLAKKNEIISGEMIVKKKNLEKLQNELDQLHTGLFDPVGVKKFFSDIDFMAESTNCTIRSLNISQAESALKADQSKARSDITANRAALSVVGNYGNIVALIGKLQDRPQQVRIDSLSIKLIGGNSNQLGCDMTIMVYEIQNKEEYTND